MDKRQYISEVKVGQKVENFQAEALLANGEFGTVSLADNMKHGKWTILFFWPKDFTFVCPTEIVAMSEMYQEFKDNETEVFGISTDSVHVHKAWTDKEANDGGIGKVMFPLLEDVSHALSEQFGILIKEDGAALRGLFIVSPDGILEHATINNLNVGRNTDEILRILTACQSGGLCPMNWSKGEETL